MQIGYRFPHTGAQVLGVAPSGDAQSYIVLCKYHEQYITGRVYVRQLPVPEEWDNGTYHQSIDRAVMEWINRSVIPDEDGSGIEWMSALIRNTEKALAPPPAQPKWHHVDGDVCTSEVVYKGDTDAGAEGVCDDHDRRVWLR